MRSTALRPDIVLALSAAYILGGSNYAAIEFALTGFEPFTMLGLRFGTAALILMALGLLFAEAGDHRRPVLADILLGLVLIGGTFGGIALAQDRLSNSGFVAVVLATAPMWAALFTAVAGAGLRGREWVGMTLGVLGVATLLGVDAVDADRVGVAFAFFAALSLAAGSLLAKELPPAKPRRSAAIQMASAGAAFALMAVLSGESLVATPSAPAVVALAHQALLCSVVSYTAFVYLLGNVRAPLATSFTYVNPVVAVLIGAVILAEPLDPWRILAIATILVGVWLVLTDAKPTPTRGSPPEDERVER
ncbi:MAG: EamA family transporter [Devosia sp.]